MVLTCQMSVLLDDVSNYLDAFKTLKETSNMPYNDDF